MGEIQKSGAGYVGYEYMEIDAAGERAAFCRDCYECFGWTPEERPVPSARDRLLLKRERRLVNKVELTRLQRHFEACMEEIRALEQSRFSGATAAALCVALVGTAFVAGAVWAAVHEPPLLLPCVLLAVLGLAGWILPLFLFRWLAARRAATVAKLVEQKYDEIDTICEQGSRLLNG